MKRSIGIAVGICALCHVGFGFIWFSVDAPQDDLKLRTGVSGRPELKSLHAAYSDLIAMRLSPLTFDAIAELFGPKLDTATNWADGGSAKLLHHPTNAVVPLFVPTGMVLSGLGVGPGCKSHTDLHAIGDIGYVEFYSYPDGETVQNVAIYFRADDQFVPLKSTNDIASREAWDNGKFGQLQNWMGDHMPKVIDLGQIEVSTSHPTHIDLGMGTICIVTTRDIHNDKVPFWLSIDLAKETLDQNERRNSTQSRSLKRPDQPVGFTMDGKFYRLVTKLSKDETQLHAGGTSLRLPARKTE